MVSFAAWNCNFARVLLKTGYAIFSVSQSLRSNVAAYVRNKETHHAKKTFDTYDPRFVFDTECPS